MTSLIELMVRLCNTRLASYGKYPNYDAIKNQFPTPKDNIFITCIPKSGSTFLYECLTQLTGYKQIPIAYAGGGNEHNLYIPNLVMSFTYPTVSKHHMMVTTSNNQLMDLFAIRPIVLTRNLFDVTVSLRNHYQKFFQERKFPADFSPGGNMVFFNQEFLKMDSKTQYDAIIALNLPWFINFYVTWYNAQQHNLCDFLWITYEELMSEQVETIKKITRHYHIQKNDSDIETSIAQAQKRPIRFNKGISGRGKAELSDIQIDQIIQLTRFYPWVDFSRLGIVNE